MKMNDAKKFDKLLDEYFKQTLAARPVWANHLGVRAAEGKLGEPTTATIFGRYGSFGPFILECGTAS